MARFLSKDATKDERNALKNKWKNFWKQDKEDSKDIINSVVDKDLEYILDHKELIASVSCREDKKQSCKVAHIRDSIVNSGKIYKVNSIPLLAFKDCVNLREVKIPEGVDRLLRGTFMNCKSLEKVEIPGSVKFLIGGTFLDCTNLKIVEFENIEDMEIQAGAFLGCNEEAMVKDKSTGKEWKLKDFKNEVCKGIN